MAKFSGRKQIPKQLKGFDVTLLIKVGSSVECVRCILLGFPEDSSKEYPNVPWLKAALEVCNRIYNDHKVYLLNTVLVERELLKTELKRALTTEEVHRIIARYQGS